MATCRPSSIQTRTAAGREDQPRPALPCPLSARVCDGQRRSERRPCLSFSLFLPPKRLPNALVWTLTSGLSRWRGRRQNLCRISWPVREVPLHRASRSSCPGSNRVALSVERLPSYPALKRRHSPKWICLFARDRPDPSCFRVPLQTEMCLLTKQKALLARRWPMDACFTPPAGHCDSALRSEPSAMVLEYLFRLLG